MPPENLENLSPEALGQLFPVVIVPHSDHWPALFFLEKKMLLRILTDQVALRIEHFGSTAIPGLPAKPVVDILIEIPPLTDTLKNEIIAKMKGLGYTFIWREEDPVPYMNFVKGYSPQGYHGNLFHVHMADASHSLWDRLYFRDFLKSHPEKAGEYAVLKMELAKRFPHDREAYTQGKAEFVQQVTQEAKAGIKKEPGSSAP